MGIEESRGIAGVRPPALLDISHDLGDSRVSGVPSLNRHPERGGFGVGPHQVNGAASAQLGSDLPAFGKADTGRVIWEHCLFERCGQVYWSWR